jgi:hypothetical protein
VGRRDLLWGLFGLGATVLTGAAGVPAALQPPSAALGDWLRNFGPVFFRDLPALRRLGARYLVAHPAERSRVRLSRLLIPADEGAIPAQLLRGIARDWAANHVVVVDGWLLARTEARLCALLQLEEDPRP